MTANARCPRPVDNVKYRDLGDEFLFYDQSGDQLHVLNGSARTIYLLCDGTRTEEQVADEFAMQHEGAADARGDAQKVIAELLELGLLRVS